jgi:hypothetical protein
LAIFFLRHFFAFPIVLTSLARSSAATDTLVTSLAPLLLPPSAALFALRLALGNPALFALGDKVAFLFGIAQYPIPRHSFSESF